MACDKCNGTGRIKLLVSEVSCECADDKQRFVCDPRGFDVAEAQSCTALTQAEQYLVDALNALPEERCKLVFAHIKEPKTWETRHEAAHPH